MSVKAKTRAKNAVGQKLTTTDNSVLDRGLMPCMPTRARMAALPNPKPDKSDSSIASMD